MLSKDSDSTRHPQCRLIVHYFPRSAQWRSKFYYSLVQFGSFDIASCLVSSCLLFVLEWKTCSTRVLALNSIPSVMMRLTGWNLSANHTSFRYRPTHLHVVVNKKHTMFSIIVNLVLIYMYLQDIDTYLSCCVINTRVTALDDFGIRAPHFTGLFPLSLWPSTTRSTVDH